MAPDTVTDPVCGMPVDAATAVPVELDGRIYYFCESVCADMFREDPARWIPEESAAR